MAFTLYVLGFIIMIAGVALGAYSLHVSPDRIGVAVLIIIAIGLATGMAATRQRDPS